MKSFVYLACLVFLLGLNSGVSVHAASNVVDGNEGAYGGDDVSLEFKTIASTALLDIEQNRPEIAKLFSVGAAKKALELVRILGVPDNLELSQSDGTIQKVVAVNYPGANLILVQSDRWHAIAEPKLKAGLALHEILSLIGIESTGIYSISSQYAMQALKPRPFATCNLEKMEDGMKGVAPESFSFDMQFSRQRILALHLFTTGPAAQSKLQAFAQALGVTQPEQVMGLTYMQHASTDLHASDYSMVRSCSILPTVLNCYDALHELIPEPLVFQRTDGSQQKIFVKRKSLYFFKQVSPGVFNIEATLNDGQQNAKLLIEFKSLNCSALK